MGLYQILRTLDPTLVSDVRMSAIEALQKGTTDYYVTLYDKLLDESVETETDQGIEQDQINKAFGGNFCCFLSSVCMCSQHATATTLPIGSLRTCRVPTKVV